jgi:hypothetical protein
MLYATNAWPFTSKSLLDCSIRVVHASFFQSSLPPAGNETLGPRAPTLMPADLMNAEGREAEPGRVPRLIHQSWKDREPPHRFRVWSDSWRRNHPGWSYVLWCALALCRTNGPSLIASQDRCGQSRTRQPVLSAVSRRLPGFAERDLPRRHGAQLLHAQMGRRVRGSGC